MNETIQATWAVELDGFAKSYRSGWIGGRTHAVHALTLRLAPGQVLGVLGPNGSGKSTSLKALAGLIAPTSGRCRIMGHPAGSDAARALVGWLPESPQYPLHLSGQEFLFYCAALSSLTGDRAVQRVAEVLEWSGLGPAAGRLLATYSKGMRQRLGLAQTILHDPPVVLLDEPSSGLDPAGRIALTELLRGLAAGGKTVVFSSHLLAHAEDVCDRLAILGRGRLLVDGTVGELFGAGPAVRVQPSRLEQLYLEKLLEHECIPA